MNFSPADLFKNRQLFAYLHTEATDMFARVDGIYQVVEERGFDLPLVQSKIAELRKELASHHARLMETEDSREMKELIDSIAAQAPEVNQLYLVMFDAVDQKLQHGTGPAVEAARNWIAQMRKTIQLASATPPSPVSVH